MQEQRLEVATQRLLFTEESIEQIAVETGFNNRFYLSRVFTRKIGIPPADYRKSVCASQVEAIPLKILFLNFSPLNAICPRLNEKSEASVANSFYFLIRLPR